jgi:long-chain-fatty-acid--CoA ligase ACSBG
MDDINVQFKGDKYKTHLIDGEVAIRMGTSGAPSRKPETIVEAFMDTVNKNRNSPVYHQQDKNGVWQTWTWQEYHDEVCAFAKSLIHLGVERFGVVNIIGFNSPEWVIAQIGAIFAAGVGAGVYATNSSDVCQYIAEDSKAQVVVCDGMKQLEKYVSIAKDLPNLKALVMYNAEVPEGFECSVPVYSFKDFQKLGASVDQKLLDERMTMNKPGHCCSLIYTSGTTGPPKGVMISNDNFTWIVKVVIDMFSKQFGGPINAQDRMISYLPLSHVAAQLLDILAPVCCGMQIYFAKPDALKGSLAETLRHVRPTIFFGVPRVWEKLMDKMVAVGKSKGGLAQSISGWAKSKGAAKSKMAEYGNSGGAPCGYGIASLLLNKIKDVIGLDQAKGCFTGAAPISLEVLNYFGSLDIPVYELFGQSECTGPQDINLPGLWRVGTTGVKIVGTLQKVDKETGEFIYQGRNIMMGYLNQKDKTNETIDDGGWLHSGDMSKIDEDGFMSITGRIKDLIITAGGENIPPILIEDKIKEKLSALSNVVAIGDKRKFLTALFTFRVKMNADGTASNDLDPIAIRVLKEHGIDGITTVQQARDSAEVKAYLDKGLAAANKEAISRAQNIGKYTILDGDFTEAAGEMTPTLKLKRNVVNKKYLDVIDEMYGDK